MSTQEQSLIRIPGKRFGHLKFHPRFVCLCGVLAIIFCQQEKICIGGKLWLTHSVRFAVKNQSPLAIFCGSVLWQEMYGRFAEVKFRNIPMMLGNSLLCFGCLLIGYHSWSWIDGRQYHGRYGILEINTNLNMFSNILE